MDQGPGPNPFQHTKEQVMDLSMEAIEMDVKQAEQAVAMGRYGEAQVHMMRAALRVDLRRETQQVEATFVGDGELKRVVDTVTALSKNAKTKRPKTDDGDGDFFAGERA